jgi:hypothetical protein
MADKEIAAFIKRAPSGIYCLCPALCLLSMDRLPNKRTLNFNSGRINGFLVDSGGWTYYYLLKHPELRVSQASVLYSHQLYLGDTHIHRVADMVSDAVKTTLYQNCGFNDDEIDFLLKKPDTFEFYLDNYFLHYRGGSTTDTAESYKFRIFADFFTRILKH